MFDFVDGVGDTFDSVSEFFDALNDSHTWLRVFLVLFGTLLMWMAIKYG